MGNERHLVGISVGDNRQFGRKVSRKNIDFAEIGILFAHTLRKRVLHQSGSGQRLKTEFVPIQVIAWGNGEPRMQPVAPIRPDFKAKGLFSG